MKNDSLSDREKPLKKKHALIILLAASLLFCSIAAPASAAVKMVFWDVGVSNYFYNAVTWAVCRNITSGTTDTTFSPEKPCTRAQAVTFLWRANGSKKVSGVSNPFRDVKTTDYYYYAVLWASKNKITSGVDADHFGPDQTCSRGQIVSFMWRTEGKPGSYASIKFRDVPSDAYYYNPVRWAVRNGVTQGTTAQTFSPDDPCTRGQIVTLLYRYYFERYINADHGSAHTLDGKVAIVSIFANDTTCRWNNNSAADRQAKTKTVSNLGIAAQYLTQQAARYGKNVSFVYDWRTYSDLAYNAVFNVKLVRPDGSMYYEQNEWMLSNIDIPALVKKYQVNSILFMFFFNTPYSSDVNPWTIGHTSGDYIKLEFVNLYIKFKNFDTPTATYAHEIMHTFGAHDLYYANSWIPQAYVDHLSSIKSEDIMFTVYSSEQIRNLFSDLDAYYVGIASRPYEANVWSLGKSEFGR